MTPEPTLLIATSNAGKVREIKSMLERVPVSLISLADRPGLPEVVEDGCTFEDNARRKAEHYARLTGLLSLADDSGLEVDALGGAPGIYSARYAGIPGDDAANNARLLCALQDIPPQERTARFQCVVVLADSNGSLGVGRGSIEGLILDAPRGCNGFGYDPLFYVSELGWTAAQLPSATKNRISHRARALAAIRPAVLRAIASNTPTDS